MSARLAREVVIERDRPEELRYWDFQAAGSRAQRLLAEVAVAFLECMKQGQEGGLLTSVLGDELFVGLRQYRSLPRAALRSNEVRR